MIPVVGASLLVGIAVTILEAVCTGQMYVPTLLYIIKTTPNALVPLFLLCWYNLMFVLPLLSIIGFLVIGGNNETIQRFFKKNLGTIKILQGLFFVVLFFLFLYH
jgi:hypothetical protein